MQLHRLKYLLLLLVLILSSEFSAQTVGTLLNTEDSYHGYTLIAPNRSPTTYLINNCGEVTHSWPSQFQPGLSTYLLDDGSILHTRNMSNSTFNGGGSGGGLEIIDWDGNVVWEYTISSDTACQHHDLEILPNGNILTLVWEYIPQEEVIMAGRVESNPSNWSEKVLELKPNFETGETEIVWEWRAWDHIVQDTGPEFENFGQISENPQLLDVNYHGTARDWIHFNAVDYHPKLDQIALSSFFFSEVMIIDHSTTTEEAASHEGGKYNKGGDLLYRWGNPRTYGIDAPQQLFRQHDTRWILDSLVDGGKIMVFNNRAGMNPVNFSTVNVINVPLSADSMSYEFGSESYLPETFDWTYQAANPEDLFSSNISGAQRLPDGNTLITEGNRGTLYEVDYTGKLLWNYVVPLSGEDPITQGNPAIANSIFKCDRYSFDHPAFEGRDLVSQGVIELNSTEECDLFGSTSTLEISNIEAVKIYPNPAANYLTIEELELPISSLRMYDVIGKQIYNQSYISSEIDVSFLNEGLYFVEVVFDHNKGSIIQKVVISR